MAKTPWARFGVGPKSTRRNWVENTCRPFDTVAHVTHVSVAARILEDGVIRAGLIFDKSKLNQDRILVAWLSPNDWNDGYRYGGLRFQYTFEDLVAGKRAYWVESIAYGIAACRILITDVDRDSQLEPYDPTLGDGPWWRDTDGQHYRNGEHTLEFMLERDLDIGDAVGADTVKHHAAMCNIDPKRCLERGMSAATAGARVLASVLSRPIDAELLRWTENDDAGTTVPSYQLRTSFHAFLGGIPFTEPGHFTGGVCAGSAQAHALVRAIGGAFLQQDQVAALTALFDSRASLETAAVEAVAEIFDLDNPSQLPF